jgi:hypothetical protein
MNLIEKSVFQGLGQGQQPVDELVQVEMFDSTIKFFMVLRGFLWS